MEKLRSLSDALAPVGLFALRGAVGVVMVVHGWMKLGDYAGWEQNLAALGIPAVEILAPLSILAELAGGAGLIVGLLTPIAAAGVLANMVVAIAVVHLDHGLLARDGGFEYPLVLAAAALYLLLRGAGPISLDHLVFGKKRPSPEPPRKAPLAIGRQVEV